MENIDEMSTNNFIEDSHEYFCRINLNEIIKNTFFFSPKRFINYLACELKVLLLSYY